MVVTNLDGEKQIDLFTADITVLEQKEKATTEILPKTTTKPLSFDPDLINSSC